MIRAAIVIALLLMSGTAARAALVAYEPFNYPAGSIVGLNGGSGFSGPWIDGTAVSGSLSFGSYQGTGNSAIGGLRELSTTLGVDNTQLWASFLIRPNSTGGSPFAVIGFNDLAVGILGGPTGMGPPSATWGMDTVGGSNAVLSAVPVVPNETALLVVHMTFLPGNDQLDLYVNPTTGTVPLTPDATKTDLDLYTGSDLAILGPSSIYDEIRIGTTYADVVPFATPEPSGLILGGLGLVGLFFTVRRHKVSTDWRDHTPLAASRGPFS